MSKVFEALRRLERGSSRLQQGTLAVSSPAGPTPSVDDERQKTAAAGQVPPATSTAFQDHCGSVFDLNQVPVEDATITSASRLVYHLDPDSPGADRFRLLRMHLGRLWESGKLRTLFVTSARAKDGKSTIVLSLATALAERGQRNILVIDGDLVRSSVAERLGIENRRGLAECLEDSLNPLLLVRRIGPLGWYLLSSGRPNTNPTELLQSSALSNVFEVLRPHFDWIIIDTPPVIPLTDTLSIARYADAGLLVLRADRTPRHAVQNAIARIGSQHLLGMILNGSEECERLYSQYNKSYSLRSQTQGRVPRSQAPPQ